ncbi:MAG: phosphoribosylamine--glycine ligase [Candidatus Berkelbacteria bacterium]|nr:MAG: phosphoribosylamine--glycine ligase [Candidatus Berkelbacteria bacterium]QQG52152.1 MAG: phosphoribosylamine--glycine ligase [Candidatus Berkelbacteria bacterium]
MLIVGSGGREHALAWKLCQSPKVNQVFVSPGNAGTDQIAQNVPISALSIDELAVFAAKNNIGLTVVGPDNALAAGIVDVFMSRGLRIFGPSQRAAAIESSKVFAKQLMETAGIPTASFRSFRQFDQALSYIRECNGPLVVKASGLALGKGVYPCHTTAQAEDALNKIMIQRIHGDAGDTVVVEDFLIGEEVSIHAICDGRHATLFPPSKDYKTINEGGCGENTGGMGSVTPVPGFKYNDLEPICSSIVGPALKALADLGAPFVGCLYPGLMITEDGIKTLECNARPGDPETQAYVRSYNGDLFDLFDSAVEGGVESFATSWRRGYAVCVVIASGGYPDPSCQTGFEIRGIEDAEKVPGVVVFHAGTRRDDCLRTAGGRVLGVTAVGDTLPEALENAYKGVAKISFEGMHYRRDIGADLLLRS